MGQREQLAVLGVTLMQKQGRSKNNDNNWGIRPVAMITSCSARPAHALYCMNVPTTRWESSTLPQHNCCIATAVFACRMGNYRMQLSHSRVCANILSDKRTPTSGEGSQHRNNDMAPKHSCRMHSRKQLGRPSSLLRLMHPQWEQEQEQEQEPRL